MRWTVIPVLIVALLAPACTSDDAEPVLRETLSVNDYSYFPASVGETIAVHGFYFDDPARLCGIALDSDPPQCGGYALFLDPDPFAVYASIITVAGELTAADTVAVASWNYGLLLEE